MMFDRFNNSKTEPDKSAASSGKRQWSRLELSKQSLLSLSPRLFDMTFLTHLYINQNRIEHIPPGIGRLEQLEYLDASNNHIRALPPAMGRLQQLKELVLYNNKLTTLPYEMGAMGSLKTLDLNGNPISDEIHIHYSQGLDQLLTWLLDHTPEDTRQPPERMWVLPKGVVSKPEGTHLSVFCYNILCDKYATRQAFRYCPQRALDWEHRKGLILKDIVEHSSDLICLQEVETRAFYEFLLPELKQRGFEGLFKPKSRARTMDEHDRRSVDGLATFYNREKFRLVADQLVEFDRLSTRHASGCPDMLNRVMPKDNIALLTLLEHMSTGHRVVVVNLHLTWDPVYKDVKIIQTMLTMHELRQFLKKHDVRSAPMLMMGDFNSLPDSGVYEYMSTSKVSPHHEDFEDHDYSKFFEKVGSDHPFRLKSAYTTEIPFSNYTPRFKGVIDYIWYSHEFLRPGALLGPMDEEYMQHVDGFPNDNVPSDHISLSCEFVFANK